MHIALLSPGWPAQEYPNGIVTYVHYLRRELIRQGHRVSVFAKALSPANNDSGIYLVERGTAYRIQRRLAALIGRQSEDVFTWGRSIAQAVNRVHRSDPIDIVEMEESFGWCADVQRLSAVPVVVKLHGPAFLTLVDDDLRTDFAARKIEREGEALRKIHAVVSPSLKTYEQTLSRYGLRPVVGKVIPNPIAMDDDAKPWRLDACDRKTILFVGRFDKLKGGDIALVAFKKLLEFDPNLRLIFAGPDVGINTPHGRAGLITFRDSLFPAETRDRVEYLGTLPRKSVNKLRAQAMVTLVLSRWENQPNTALEAMIQGCPIVASNSGGMAEIIEDGVTGLLAAQNDIEDLCRKIMLVMSNPEMATRMGEAARKFATARHSSEALTRAALDVYREIIAAKRGAR